jgi:hypothetical protein
MTKNHEITVEYRRWLAASIARRILQGYTRFENRLILTLIIAAWLWSVVSGIAGSRWQIITGFVIIGLSFLVLISLSSSVKRAGEWMVRTERRILNSYISACLSIHVAPSLSFVLFLRPFASDLTSRFTFPASRKRDAIFRGPTGRPLANEQGFVWGLSLVLRKSIQSLGAWIEVDPFEMTNPNGSTLHLPEDEWQELVRLLCIGARLIVVLPFVDVELTEPLEDPRPLPLPPFVDQFLSKREQPGLEFELSVITDSDLLPKTIFVIPDSLSAQEIARMNSRLLSYGIDIPHVHPGYSADYLYLYRHVTKGSPAAGVSVRVDYSELTSVFTRVGEPHAILKGNPFEFLLGEPASGGGGR